MVLLPTLTSLQHSSPNGNTCSIAGASVTIHPAYAVHQTKTHATTTALGHPVCLCPGYALVNDSLVNSTFSGVPIDCSVSIIPFGIEKMDLFAWDNLAILKVHQLLGIHSDEWLKIIHIKKMEEE